jgi:hypothetical protein
LAGSSEILLVNNDNTNSDLKDIDFEEMMRRSDEIIRRADDVDVFHTGAELTGILEQNNEYQNFLRKVAGEKLDFKDDEDNDDEDVPDLEETTELKVEQDQEPSSFKSDISPFSQMGDQFDVKFRKPQRVKSGFGIDSEYEKLKSIHHKLPVFPTQVEEEVKPVKSLKVPKSSKKAVAFEDPKDEDDEDDEDDEEEVDKSKSKFAYVYKSPKGGFAIPGKNRTQTAEIMENLRAELWFKGFKNNLSDKERQKAINALSYKKLQTELANFK